MICKFVCSPDNQCHALAFLMNFLSTIALGGFTPSAAAAGVISLILFAVVGAIAGPNLSKFDVEDNG
ncbi:Predicted protein [Prochlorococcus marinus subsp. marinus str. CCMP1375]|uniref:Uncharacterized protein n=1 Tax=Prochlorococcus marinus (strain SARG / CCMP1375 / SS120) TaxID=167539 RepID=Q7VCP8_PROMA|nr:Predicted protein [Prochlorococcus marinus subsp. marinus str. CCMP1375]